MPWRNQQILARCIAVKLEAAGGGPEAASGSLGKGGGKLLPLCDFSIVVGGEDSAMIQEAHQITMHAVCEVADRIAPTDS